ncbi:MAG: tetratricopeptide repeat protein [Bacteroidota bacterium]
MSISVGILVWCGLLWASGLRAQTSKADSIRTELNSATADSSRARLYHEFLKAISYRKPDTVLSLTREFRKVAERLGDPLYIARSWNWEAYVYRRRSDYKTALPIYQKAVSYYREAKFAVGEINGMINIGTSLSHLQKVEAAYDTFQDALRRATIAKNPRLQGSALNNIAVQHSREGKYALAGERFREVLDIMVAEGDSFEVANVTNNLGNINLKTRKYDEAIAWYVRSARIDEELHNFRGLATGYNNIAHIYNRIGDIEQAREYMNSSYKAYETAGNAPGMAMSLAGSASMLREQGDFEAAYKLDLQALDTCLAHDVQTHHYGHVLTGIGRYHHLKGDQYTAISYFEKAHKIFEDNGWTSNLPSMYRNMGSCYKSLEQFDRATSLFVRALDLVTKSGDKEEMADINKSLGELYEARGDYQKALEFFQTSTTLTDSVNAQKNVEKIAHVQAEYDIEKRKRELAEEKQRTEALQYKAELSDSRMRLTVAIVVALVLAVLGLLLLLRYRARQARLLLDKEQVIAAQRLAAAEAEKLQLQQQSEQQAREIGKRTQVLQQVREELEAVQQKMEGRGPEEFIHLFKVVEHNIRSEEDWAAFKQNFERIHPTFFPNLLARYPDLTASEIRLCVLLRLGMGQKDIANIINVNPDSVKRARNRLRQKLGMQKEQGLREFLSAF